MITPAQCRMARAALDITVRQLATQAHLSKTTVVRFEKGEPTRQSTIEKIENTFTQLNVEFESANEHHGAGVRLKDV